MRCREHRHRRRRLRRDVGAVSGRCVLYQRVQALVLLQQRPGRETQVWSEQVENQLALEYMTNPSHRISSRCLETTRYQI